MPNAWAADALRGDVAGIPADRPTDPYRRAFVEAVRARQNAEPLRAFSSLTSS